MLALSLAGALGAGLSAVLIAAGLVLAGQFVAGLAIAALTFTVYLSEILAGAWPEDDGGGPPGNDGQSGSPPPGTPGDGVDWDRFERDFRAYVDDREKLVV